MRSIHAAQPNDWQKEARQHTAAIAELHCTSGRRAPLRALVHSRKYKLKHSMYSRVNSQVDMYVVGNITQPNID